MRNILSGVLMVVALLGVQPANAQTKLVVVELYTSQGCSSCPPADDLLTRLVQKDHVIALALHVDYWDYIGWKDIYGDPAFTSRQKSYASAAGNSMIYTPQMIIGGTDFVVGNKPMDVADSINDQSRLTSTVNLQLVRKGNSVQISASSAQKLAAPAIVQLVRYEPSESVKITRGENAGRTINYSNIVTDWRKIGEWDGAKPLTMTAKAKGDAPVVVIIQLAGPGRVLAAARLR